MIRAWQFGRKVLLGLFAVGLYVAGCDTGASSSGGVAGGTSTSNAGGSSGSGFNLTQCRSCTGQQCASADSTCASTTGCTDMLNCYMNCGQTDSACRSNCVGSRSTDAQLAAATFAACIARTSPSLASASKIRPWSRTRPHRKEPEHARRSSGGFDGRPFHRR